MNLAFINMPFPDIAEPCYLYYLPSEMTGLPS